MKNLQMTLAVAAFAGLSACATIPNGVSYSNEVTRNIDPTTALLSAGPVVSSASAPSYLVTGVNVDVPETLVVSEANTYKPRADIVWRGDPMGDRYQQISTLVKDAMMRGVSGVAGEQAVTLDIQVTRFHALTERTRYSFGGTHDIHFWLTIRDAETGDIIMPARMIETELTALGGSDALAAEARGETQKVRISEHLAYLIQQELAAATTMPVT